MSNDLDDLYRKAMHLSLDDRASLAGKLMASIAKECRTDADAKWRDGMLNRIANGDPNAARLIEWEEAKRRTKRPKE